MFHHIWCWARSFFVWVSVGTLAPYCTSVGRRASFVFSGGLSGSKRPDVHHCCLRDRQVKRMLCSVHPPLPRGVPPAQPPVVHDSGGGTGFRPRLSASVGTAGVGGLPSGCGCTCDGSFVLASGVPDRKGLALGVRRALRCVLLLGCQDVSPVDRLARRCEIDCHHPYHTPVSYTSRQGKGRN